MANNAIENLKAAINELTTAEEIREGYDLLKARNGRLAASAVLRFNPGDPVSFKGKHGIPQTGKVIDVNRKTVTVETTSGQRWRVAPNLLTRTEAGVNITWGEAGVTPGKRPESEILNDLARVFCALSPENLNCDGEISRSEAIAKERKLEGEKVRLFAELGRVVDEMEVYRLTGSL